MSITIIVMDHFYCIYIMPTINLSLVNLNYGIDTSLLPYVT